MTKEEQQNDESQDTNLGIQAVLRAVTEVIDVVRQLAGATVTSEEALSAIIEESKSETGPTGGTK